MANKYEYNGHEYWVTVTTAIDPTTNEGAYVAFVRNEEPDGILYGEQIRDGNGVPIFFPDVNSALTYANDIKQNEIDGGIQGFF